ncbi:MAG TPA: 23S rRNA (pseudouridine(1915)-N(3))-methyltransferase RlmH [Usitatibacter sp.]|jgi:23S rRNA (pseudouridine1915-N3)-methyltransferase|nr:23S rRNA (pseudouridine(1915)-N(3))-methyltransferase RlmH [Usitatibacter sp.]
MRVSILSVGHKMPAWIQKGFEEYTRRMPPEIRVELVELKPDDRSTGKTLARAMQAEGERMLAAVPDKATLLALDEKGRAVSTQGLSVMLADWMRDGSHPTFAIGGADGLDAAVKDRADKLISLSALTLPHGLVRVLLAEQLYRAWTILARHPYHRE